MGWPSTVPPLAMFKLRTGASQITFGSEKVSTHTKESSNQVGMVHTGPL